MKIKTKCAVGSPFCVATLDGLHLRQDIEPFLAEGYTVHLSLEGVEVLSPAFIEALLRTPGNNEPNEENISFVDASDADLALIRTARNNLQRYAQDPGAYEHAWGFATAATEEIFSA